ncbi:SET and MYND domain-containing protein 5 [Folsomia candida]|uniref:SET and MYND domain-containing protein 5 n=2 Tax=Folsomia candida TaxID=158441 RepID=A0A226DYU5_FOLCA|nr:SET and MYND domain-containing protein 5 [Folsomia candida]
MYCSAQCKEKAFNEYHQILCFHAENPPENVSRLDDFWRSMHYPPETSNIMLLVRLLVKLHLDSDKSLLQRIGNFCQASANEDEELAHKVLGDEYSLQVTTLRQLVISIVNFPNIQQWLTPEGFLKLFVLIGRNSQGVGTSPFATYVENVEKQELPVDEKKAVLDTIDHIYEVMDSVIGHFMDNEGVALYPLQSWVNHSCVPNCEVKFPEKNHRVGLIALEDIAIGEEIKISYLDLADLSRSRYSRNKYLKEHYLFSCDCPKCLEQMDDEDGTTDSNEEMSDDEDEDGNEMSE